MSTSVESIQAARTLRGIALIVLLWINLLASSISAQDIVGGTITPEQRQAWRAQIRSTLFVPDPLPDLDAATHGRFEPVPGVIAERVTYNTQLGMRVPAILYLPRSDRGAFLR